MSDWLKQMKQLGDEMPIETRRPYYTQSEIDEAVRIEESLRAYRKIYYGDLVRDHDRRTKVKRFWDRTMLAWVVVTTLLALGMSWLILGR